MRRALTVGSVALGLLLACGRTPGADAADDGVLKPAHSVRGAVSLADLGAQQLERLPWGVNVIQVNLSARQPVAIAGAYLMKSDLLCVSSTGMVYCLSRRDLSPRWVSSLEGRLAYLPTEGPTHYAFIVQAHDGKYLVHAFAKRNGADANGYPVRLPFAVSAPAGVDGGQVYLGSLEASATRRRSSPTDWPTAPPPGATGPRASCGPPRRSTPAASCSSSPARTASSGRSRRAATRLGAPSARARSAPRPW